MVPLLVIIIIIIIKFDFCVIGSSPCCPTLLSFTILSVIAQIKSRRQQQYHYNVPAPPENVSLTRVPLRGNCPSSIFLMVGIEIRRLLMISRGNSPAVLCAPREISQWTRRKCNMISQKVKKITRLSELSVYMVKLHSVGRVTPLRNRVKDQSCWTTVNPFHM